MSPPPPSSVSPVLMGHSQLVCPQPCPRDTPPLNRTRGAMRGGQKPPVCHHQGGRGWFNTPPPGTLVLLTVTVVPGFVPWRVQALVGEVVEGWGCHPLRPQPLRDKGVWRGTRGQEMGNGVVGGPGVAEGPGDIKGSGVPEGPMVARDARMAEGPGDTSKGPGVPECPGMLRHD